MDNQQMIEVVYGKPSKQTILTINVESDTTVEAVINESGMLSIYPEIDLSLNKVGIWNKSAKLTDIVEAGDRVEIYRPLIADPKEVRKRRAEKAKLEGRADKVTGGRVNPLRSDKNN